MAILPIRGLSNKGIMRDPSAYQLDLDTWSGGSNVRFHANKVERAPVWRTVYDALPEAPQFCAGLRPTSGFDSVMVAGADSRLWQYTSGTYTEVTPTSGFTAVTDPRAFNSTFLGDVIYINRPSAAPLYFGPSSSHFAPIPNQECAWTCRSLRAFGDYLIALNVTKPATFVDPHTGLTTIGGALPNLVKWSDLVLDGQVPDSWDPADPTKNTGENPLEALTTPIVDGLPIRSAFAIYSQNEIWAMEQVDSSLIFEFRRLFSDGGMIAPNCAVEVNGIHYVFGPTDIYKHDGFTKVSIVDKRNKDTIFRNLNLSKSEVCFAAYMPALSQIVFGFNTGDAAAAFQGCDRCNQGYVYDLVSDTGSFIDLPNVSAITLANLSSTLTYASVPAVTTYATVGGSYYDQENQLPQHVVGVSGAVAGQFTNSRLMAYDFKNKGSLSFPYQAECNAPAFVERTGLDLDQVGSDLTTYKKIRRVFPLVTIFDNVPVSIQVGGAEFPSQSPSYAPAVLFDPATQYKVDVIKGGRYLSIRFTVPQDADFEIAGYDIDVTDNGRK